MQISGREIGPTELDIFNRNPIDISGVRVFGFFFDIIITMILVITMWAHFSFGMFFLYILYAAQLMSLLLVATAQYKMSLDFRTITNRAVSYLSGYGNSAIDWPFGPQSILSTGKNIGVALVAIPAYQWGYHWMAGIIVVCSILNAVAIYYRGKATLLVLDNLMAQKKAPESL